LPSVIVGDSAGIRISIGMTADHPLNGVIASRRRRRGSAGALEKLPEIASLRSQ